MATLLVLNVIGNLSYWRNPPYRSSETVFLKNINFFIEIWVEIISILIKVSADRAADFLFLSDLIIFVGILLDIIIDGFYLNTSLFFAISIISFKNCVFFDPDINIENSFFKR